MLIMISSHFFRRTTQARDKYDVSNNSNPDTDHVARDHDTALYVHASHVQR